MMNIFMFLLYNFFYGLGANSNRFALAEYEMTHSMKTTVLHG